MRKKSSNDVCQFRIDYFKNRSRRIEELNRMAASLCQFSKMEANDDEHINKQAKLSSPLACIPLEMVFEVLTFLSIQGATSFAETSHEILALTTDAFLGEIWFSNLVRTNHPSLLTLMNIASKEKLLVHTKCCQSSIANSVPDPDLSHLLIDCSVSYTVAPSGTTVVCETCTLINPFGGFNCTICFQPLNYNGVGEMITFVQTTTPFAADGKFMVVAPPVRSYFLQATQEQVVAQKLIAAIGPQDDALNLYTPIKIRTCIFDSKTGRTFAPYFSEVEEDLLGSEEDENEFTMCFAAKGMQQENSTLLPHLRAMANIVSACMVTNLHINVSTGCITGHLQVYGDNERIENPRNVLYACSNSITAEVATTTGEATAAPLFFMFTDSDGDRIRIDRDMTSGSLTTTVNDNIMDFAHWKHFNVRSGGYVDSTGRGTVPDATQAVLKAWLQWIRSPAPGELAAALANKVEVGRIALFALPDDAPRTDAQDIAAAEIALTTVMKDTTFVVSIRKCNSATVLHHEELCGVYDADERCLKFTLSPACDAYLDPEEVSNLTIEVLAVSALQKTMCHLFVVNLTYEGVGWEEHDPSEISSHSLLRFENSFNGSILNAIFEDDFFIVPNVFIGERDDGTWQMEYHVSDYALETKQNANVLHAFLQMLLIDGSVNY